MARVASRVSVPAASPFATSMPPAPSAVVNSLTLAGSGSTPRRPAICGMSAKLTRPRADVAADLLAVELDAIDRGVRPGARLVDRETERGHAEHAATRRHELAIGAPRRSGV